MRQDGFLNEDEQVLLFSLFKGKMLTCAQQLLVIFDYKRFHDLMKCVRNLEHNINMYQDILRTRIYDDELCKYREIGSEKIFDFMDRYTDKHFAFEEAKRKKLDGFDNARKDMRDAIEKGFDNDPKLVQFKPKLELKEYLKNERLVALEERIEEATNFRKELDKLSTKESDRLRHNM